VSDEVQVPAAFGASTRGNKDCIRRAQVARIPPNILDEGERLTA